MSHYDDLLADLLDTIAAEAGAHDFDRLEYSMEIRGPRAVNLALVLYQGGRRNPEEGLGDDWWMLTLSRKVQALKAASVAEGRGDFSALTLTLFPDGKFDLDFTYPEPVAQG